MATKKQTYTSDQVKRIAEAAAKYGAAKALEEFAAANHRIAPDVKQKLNETAKSIRATFDE